MNLNWTSSCFLVNPLLAGFSNAKSELPISFESVEGLIYVTGTESLKNRLCIYRYEDIAK